MEVGVSFDFATAPRQLLTRIEIPDGARWCEMSVRAGLLGYAGSAPPHRLGYDFACTSESLLVAFARHQQEQARRTAWEASEPTRRAWRELQMHLHEMPPATEPE
jgi:hypothetical protein